MKKCLVVDRMHESLFPMLEAIGWVADYKPEITREEIRKIHHLYAGLIVRSKTFINADLLGENPSIQFVGRAGAGMDNLDLEYLSKHRIHILHAAEGNRDAVGEYAIGALLALTRNIVRANQEVRSFTWHREENRGIEIMGKTVGIVGYGNMGMAFAKKLSGFGCKVLAFDKYKSAYSDEYAKESSEEQIFEEADILSLHIPLTSETRNMVTSSYINRFRKNIILINTSRGEIVSQMDIIQSLQNGKIRGAVLDVLENEKMEEFTASERSVMEQLFQNSNVIFTPHIAGWTFESHVKINVALTDKIKLLNL